MFTTGPRRVDGRRAEFAVHPQRSTVGRLSLYRNGHPNLGVLRFFYNAHGWNVVWAVAQKPIVKRFYA